ncbi:MAG: hypothetical protein WCE21_05335 [Candidatus Babeliales bacterium]
MKQYLFFLLCISNTLLFGMEPNTSEEEKNARAAVEKIWFNACTIDATNDGHTKQVYDVQFTPDGEFFISSSADQTIKIFDMTTMKCVHAWGKKYDGYDAAGGFLAISPDGKWFAASQFPFVGSAKSELPNENIVELYDLVSREFVDSVACDYGVYKMLFNKEGTHFSCMHGLDDTVFAVPAMKEDASVKISWQGLDAYIANSPDGRWKAHRDGNDIYIAKTENANIRLYDDYEYDSLTMEYNFKESTVLDKNNGGHMDRVNSIQFSPNSRWLISSSYDNTIKLFKQPEV